MSQHFLYDVMDERIAQDEMWGEQNHEPAYWVALVTAQVGDTARALHASQHDLTDYRAGLVKIAALATAAGEALDRSLER
jgi:hypothetical protein